MQIFLSLVVVVEISFVVFGGGKVQSPSTSSLSLSRRTDVSQGILDEEIYRNKGKLSNNIIFGGFRADRLPSERVWLQLTVFFSVCKLFASISTADETLIDVLQSEPGSTRASVTDR